MKGRTPWPLGGLSFFTVVSCGLLPAANAGPDLQFNRGIVVDVWPEGGMAGPRQIEASYPT
jgi:hypothetical protein